MNKYLDSRHNPDRALYLIRAAHRGGGQRGDAQHIENARNGWVQHIKADEVIVTRNGKTGYRTSGVNHGPLREMSFLERRLLQQEQTFLKQLARYDTLDDSILRLAAHQKRASRIGVSKRITRAQKVETAVINLYLDSILPIHLRASFIAARLEKSGHDISVRSKADHHGKWPAFTSKKRK